MPRLKVSRTVEWIGVGIAAIGYVALLIYSIPRHEPWADEAQAWQLASHLTLRALFKTYIHYEASPGLWHAFLWLLSRLHTTYAGMHWVTGLVALSGVWLLLTRSPFPLFLRLILPFGYFLAYQYAAIARSYVLFLPILAIGAILWPVRWQRPLATAFILGLCANISIHSLVISIALSVVLAIEWIQRRHLVSNGRRILPGAVLLGIALLWAVWCIFPKPDAGWVYRAHSVWKDTISPARDVQVATEHPGTRTFPPMVRKALAECVDILKAYRHPMTDRYQLGLVIWALFFVQLTYSGMLRYALPTLPLAVVSPPFQGHIYHAGLMWLLFLFLWWITLNEHPRQTGARRWIHYALILAVTCCAVTHVSWASRAIKYDAAYPYSPDRDGAVVLSKYLSEGRRVVLDVPQKTGTQGTLSEYFAVGLEPYFSTEPISNMSFRFWFWGGDEGMRAAFLQAIASGRPVVLVEETYEDPRFLEAEAQLVKLGFARDRIVCGQRFYPDDMIFPLCHAFYKRT